MNQVTQWLDLSQIYNSRRSNFFILNQRNQATDPKLTLTNRNGEDYMPACPTGQVPANWPSNSCASCLRAPKRFPQFSSAAQDNANRANCMIGGRENARGSRRSP